MKRSIFAYLFLLVGVLLIAFSMEQNGNAYAGNFAWSLIKTLRLILIWVGGLPLALWLIYKLISWREKEVARKNQLKINEINQLIDEKLKPVLRYQDYLSSKISSLEKKIDQLEHERRQDKVILKEIEEKQKRSIEDVTQDALDAFI